jgi:outer membrane protein TolC
MAIKNIYPLLVFLILSFLVFISTVTSVLADETDHSQSLELSQALEEASAHSPTVQRLQAAYDESKWKQAEAVGAGFLPKLVASGSHNFNEKFQYLNVNLNGQAIVFPSIYPTSSGSLDLQVPLFDGLANLDHASAASEAKDASELELKHAQFELEQSVKLAFFRALGAQQLEAVAEQNVSTLENHLKIADANQKGGSGTKYDVLRVQVQLTEAKTDALDAVDNVSIARRKLTELLGATADDRALKGDLPIPHLDSVQKLTLSGQPEDRADLRAMDLKTEAAASEARASNKWLVPSLAFAADYTVYNNINASLGDGDAFRSAYNFGLTLQWRLFDGGVSIARSEEAKYQRIQAEKASEEAKVQVPYDFDLWKRKYLTNTARYEAKKLDVERSEESVRLALAEEKAGTRNSTEVLDAELDLFRSKAGVVDALVSSAEAQIELENTLGKVI